MTDKIIQFIIGLLFFLVGIFFVIGSWKAYQLDTWIVKHGIETEAVVLDHYMVYSADGDSDFNIEYTFQLKNGERREAQRGISKKQWKQIKVGDRIPIYYHPNQPNRNFPKGAGVTSFGLMVFAMIMGFIFASVGGFLLISLKR